MEKPDLIKFYCSKEEDSKEANLELDKLLRGLEKVLGTGEQLKEAREELGRVREMAVEGRRLLRENPEVAERMFKEMVVARQEQVGPDKGRRQEVRGTTMVKEKTKKNLIKKRTADENYVSGQNSRVERGASVY